MPKDNDHAETDTEAGLVRAADLIGQLADPFYPRKLNALYHEFAETGVAEQLGYHSPADVAEHYPRFFWERSSPISATRSGTCPHRRGQAVDRQPLFARVRRGARALALGPATQQPAGREESLQQNRQ